MAVAPDGAGRSRKEAVDTMHDAREFLEAVGRSVGTGLGTRCAPAFEVLPIRT